MRRGRKPGDDARSDCRWACGASKGIRHRPVSRQHADDRACKAMAGWCSIRRWRWARQDIAAIRALGPVAAIVAPNLYHHLHLRDAIAAFPDARVFVPEGLAEKIGAIPARADHDPRRSARPARGASPISPRPAHDPRDNAVPPPQPHAGDRRPDLQLPAREPPGREGLLRADGMLRRAQAGRSTTASPSAIRKRCANCSTRCANGTRAASSCAMAAWSRTRMRRRSSPVAWRKLAGREVCSAASAICAPAARPSCRCRDSAGCRRSAPG